MIQLAARATHEIKILNRQQTRGEIMSSFMVQINGLRLRLNVRLNYYSH
jgi:hypothetical protein